MTVTELIRPAAAPEPGRAGRWVPSRAGILNVWRYYDEVFSFHDGRLLLRGPNGSGKSKALELLLPFLLDANLRASRLSTFGTGERTMYWNLMGEGASSTTRVGYVWLEFGFGGDDERWFTCGCRLQASAHTPAVRADYFTTSLRVGRPGGFSLLNEAGQPLTKDALTQVLGDQGTLHGNAGDYRTAVRRALFAGLSEQRYEALITALLQLRMPKLSQRLDPGVLSTLLSRALPPLGQQEITDLAEGFERLDQQRERLVTLDEEVRTARALADRQRAYARRVLRAASATLISATSAMDTLTRAARTSAEEYDRVAAARTAAGDLITGLTGELARCDAEIDGIKDSEAYQQGRELDQLRQREAEEHARAVRLRAGASEKRSQAGADRVTARAAEHACAQRAGNAGALEIEARQAAVRAQLLTVHGELAEGAADPAGGRQLLRAAVQARSEQLAIVRQALSEHDRAVGRRQDAEAELDEARSTFGEAGDKQRSAAARYEKALAELTEGLARWAGSCRELAFPDLGALLDLAESEPELVAMVEGVATAALEEVTRTETLATGERGTARAGRDRLKEEIRALDARRDRPPEPPATRTADRTLMAGAPFWRIVDFAESVPGWRRGRIEAALTAAGLLDAWVGPGGLVDGHDTFADPAALAPAPGRSLADVLVVEKDSPVPADAVRRLLASIAYDDRLPAGHPAAIGADGRWRLGNTRGSWHKDRPAYIGAAARERARQQRLRELSGEVAEADQVIAALDARLAELRARRGALASERALRPPHAGLTAAAQAVTTADAGLAAADDAVRRRIGVVKQREGEVVAALRRLTAQASEHGLPAELGALDTLAEALGRFREQAENWLEELTALAAARRELSALLDKAAGSQAIAAERELEADEAQAVHARLAATLGAVEATIGADYRDVLARLHAVRAARTGLEHRIESTHAELQRLNLRLGQLGSDRKSDAEARDQAAGDRDAAAQRFRHLVSGVLAADSGLPGRPEPEENIRPGSEGVRAALEAARRVAAAWPNVPHAPADLSNALHRLNESVHAGRTSLSARADLDLEIDAEVQVFTAVIDGVRTGAAELLRRLEQDADRSREEITERERELFDRTLTGDTRRHLADRIRQANELVDQMNARLERVRTASKVAVRLVWQVAPELPAGTKAARDLLLKDPVRLTDADRDSLHRFFRERIEQAKADNTAASWEQQLQQVFDYTSWHQFVVKLDRSNGAGWQLLTRKLHGALSGGEKAIALHLPLFAAVAAHYQAVPEAPRLILLDEVFVGVDSSNRGQVFALLCALDLDLVLTSDHEWCTYAELGGIGIHQLITGSDGDDAVTTARFTWNGRDLIPEDGA